MTFPFLSAAAVLLALLLMIPLALAAPTGAAVTYNSTDNGPTITPAEFNNSRGTVTTVVFNAQQQDQHWKAYVGNVTGVLTLDDADGYTIYDWNLTGVTITGEVYAVRNSSVDFGNVSCLNTSMLLAEQTFNNMTTTQIDNINRTFNYSAHRSFYVGANPIANSTCRSTFTYVNDTIQATLNESTPFQEVLLQDGAANIIYATIIEANVEGYDLNEYDFQMLIAESELKSAPTTYYFYTEIAA